MNVCGLVKHFLLHMTNNFEIALRETNKSGVGHHMCTMYCDAYICVCACYDVCAFAERSKHRKKQ